MDEVSLIVLNLAQGVYLNHSPPFKCPGCPYGGLDLSRGLFTKFASEDVGVIFGSWSFIGGTDPDGKSGNTNTTTNNEPPSPSDGCEDETDPEDDGCDDDENGPTSTLAGTSKSMSTHTSIAHNDE